MTFKKISITNKLIIILLIAVLSFGLIITIKDKINLLNNHRYTIAIPYEYIINGDTSNDLNYQFFVNGKMYRNTTGGRMDGGCNKCLIGKRFIVKYYVDNPENSDLLIDKPVNNRIEAPRNGWKYIPENIY